MKYTDFQYPYGIFYRHSEMYGTYYWVEFLGLKILRVDRFFIKKIEELKPIIKNSRIYAKEHQELIHQEINSKDCLKISMHIEIINELQKLESPPTLEEAHNIYLLHVLMNDL